MKQAQQVRRGHLVEDPYRPWELLVPSLNSSL